MLMKQCMCGCGCGFGWVNNSDALHSRYRYRTTLQDNEEYGTVATSNFQLGIVIEVEDPFVLVNQTDLVSVGAFSLPMFYRTSCSFTEAEYRCQPGTVQGTPGKPVKMLKCRCPIAGGLLLLSLLYSPVCCMYVYKLSSP